MPVAHDIASVTLCVLQARRQQVCSEIDLAIVRAASSPVNSEALDRLDGIYHFDDRALVAPEGLKLPILAGTMKFGARKDFSDDYSYEGFRAPFCEYARNIPEQEVSASVPGLLWYDRSRSRHEKGGKK